MRNLLLTLIALWVCSPLFSQTKKMEIKFSIGPSVAIIYPIIKNHYYPIAGYSAGAAFQYNFTKNMGVNIGIDFEEKGAHYTDNRFPPGLGTTRVFNLKYDYISIPINYIAFFGKKVQFFMEGGGYIAFLFANNITKYDNSTNTVIKTSVIKYSQTIDAGITMGLGLSIPIKKRLAITIAAKNKLGLVNTSKENILYDRPTKMNATSFLVGMNYKFGKAIK